MTPTLEDGVASQFNCLLERNSLIRSLYLSNSSSLFLFIGGSCSSSKVNSSLLLYNFLCSCSSFILSLLIAKYISLSSFVWVFGFFLGMMMISICQIIQISKLLTNCKLQIIQIHIKITIISMNTQYISNNLSNF